MALAVAAVIVAAVAGLLSRGGSSGGGDDRAVTPDLPAPEVRQPARGRREAEPTPTPDTQVVEGDGELAIGITEPNPAFVWPAGVRDWPEPFGARRNALHRLGPRYYRLVVDWPTVERDLGAQQHGCMRDIGPCAPWKGVREQLRALAAAQRAQPGRWEVMVVILGTPDAQAQRPHGCERGGTEPRSRPPVDVVAYEQLVRRLAAEAQNAGARVRYWSPWNEPNHPYFISPQRAACSAGAKSLAVGEYVRLARAMRRALGENQELVLGELAGLTKRKAGYTNISEFIRGLPSDLVCAATVFGQHGYVGGPDPVDDVDRALRSHGCGRTHQIWITETGVQSAKGARGCRTIRKRLKRWYQDPRVTAAFQYTLREDDKFPTGLVSTDLRRELAAHDEWVAWGARRTPQAPPPRSRC